jgi:hypothetical protein
MTVKEYLHQAYRLDQRIKSDTMEAQNLREMAGSVSAIKQSARFSLRISPATPVGRTAHRKRRWQHANDHERAA